MQIRLFFLIASLLAFGQQCYAQDLFSEGNKYVQAEILVDRSAIQPDDNPVHVVATIGVKFSIEPGWHIYWKNSGQAALPTKIAWSLPQGWSAGETIWPAPTKFLERGDIKTFGYTDEVLLSSQLFAPAVIPPDGEQITARANVKWLVCKDVCLPGRLQLAKEIPFSVSEALTPSDASSLFKHYLSLSPITKAAFDSGENGFRFTVGANHQQITPGGTINAWLDIATDEPYSLQELAKRFQVFHDPADEFEVREPSIHSLEQGEFAARILFPVIFNKDIAPGDISISGILLGSPELSENGVEANVAWELPLRVHQALAVSIPSAAVSEPLLPLVYKTKSHHELAAASKKPAQSLVTTGIWIALLSAFVAGLLLNLMPCVLPIISIKVMSFIEHADQPRRVALRSAVAFTAGILATFFVLATAVLSLRSVGEQVGWGFQFQHPVFVLGLIFVVFILSLGFFDLYHFSLPGIQKANAASDKIRSPFLKHFFDGVLATALSTPCTAPFLGTALAFAFAQPALQIYAIFFAIGLGLALPYVLLAANPRFMALLPKPGEWMYTFRQIMGFLLLATVLWLLFVLHRLTAEGIVWALFVLLLVFFSLWILKTLNATGGSKGKLAIWRTGLLLAVLSVTASVWPQLTARGAAATVSASERIDWQPYSETLIASSLAAQKPVFIDFTADWCITCKANESVVIETDAVAAAITEHQVVAIKGDWTSGDEKISKALKRFGGTGVPYYVVIPAHGGEPVVLPTLLTSTILVEALEDAAIL